MRDPGALAMTTITITRNTDVLTAATQTPRLPPSKRGRRLETGRGAGAEGGCTKFPGSRPPSLPRFYSKAGRSVLPGNHSACASSMNPSSVMLPIASLTHSRSGLPSSKVRP